MVARMTSRNRRRLSKAIGGAFLVSILWLVVARGPGRTHVHEKRTELHAPQQKSAENYRPQQTGNNSLRIFYNRLPKCGSRTVLDVLKSISTKNGFELVQSEDYSHRTLNESEEGKFVEFFNHELIAPVVYDRHLHFVNFSKFGEEWPMYINVIREPVDRLVSVFYYNQYASPKRPKSQSQGVTIDDCFSHNGRVFNRSSNLYCRLIDGDSLLLYFCGQSNICRKNHDYKTLATAKTNVERHYSVVGLTEDMDSFFKVLEVISPQIFKGASRQYIANNASMLEQTQNLRKTQPSQAVLDHLKELAAPEYEFYAFIKKRFYDQMRFCGLLPEDSYT